MTVVVMRSPLILPFILLGMRSLISHCKCSLKDLMVFESLSVFSSNFAKKNLISTMACLSIKINHLVFWFGADLQAELRW